MSETLIDAAAALLPPEGERRVLALAGPPGSGKTRLASMLVDGLLERNGPLAAAYVPLDGFHLSNRQLELLGHLDRKGAPFTFDVEGYLALLRRLRDNTAILVYAPDYDRRLHEPIAARHVIAPGTRLIVTEGNYLASAAPGWRQVAALADQLWYVDAPSQIRRERLVRRHASGGRGEEQAEERVALNDDENAAFVQRTRSACARTVASW